MYTVIWVAICITLSIEILHPVCAVTTSIICIIRQTRTVESQSGIFQPYWKIVLRVERIFLDIPLCSLIIRPKDIGGICDRRFLFELWHMVSWRAMIGERVMV